MEFFRIKKDIPFMSYGRLTTAISLITFLLAIYFLAVKGLNLGVDFTGGTMMEVSYPQTANIGEIRTAVQSVGLSDVTVQNFGTSRDVLIRLPVKEGLTTAQLSEEVMTALRQADSSVVMNRVEFVGPQVGQELYENGALALLLVSIGIMLYLYFRFEWQFALAAIIANSHDVVIIL
ncbi:MAG: protein translocase subunit SecF, partial [Nitrosomonadales bacterium]|nr:protein translocase subunit SecF [Nitrosomonadales bacterium]